MKTSHFLSLCVLLMSSALYAAQEDKATDIPVDLLFKGTVDSSFKFSPSGKYLASIKELTDQYVILITDPKQRKVVYTIPTGRVYATDLTWVTDDRLFYEVGTSIAVVSVSGSENRIILRGGAKSDQIKHATHWQLFFKPEGDPEHILLIGKAQKMGLGLGMRSRSVYRYNIYTGDVEELLNISKPKNILWRFSEQGKPIVGWQQQYAGMNIYTYDSEKKDAVFHDQISYPKSLPQLAEKVSYLNERADIVELSDDEDIFYIRHNIDSDYHKIYAYSLSKKAIVDTVYAAEKYDFNENLINKNMLFDSKQNLLGFRYFKDEDHIEWQDERLVKIQKSVDAIFPKQNNMIFNWDDNFDNVLFRNTAKNARGKIFLYSVKDDMPALFADMSPWLNEYVLPGERTVRYKSRDGVEHEAYLTMPLNMKKPLPVVIVPHSGPWRRAVKGYSAMTKYLASQGYAVLRVNYRGSTGFGRKYLLDGVKNAQQLMTQDIADSASWIVTQGIAEADKVYLLGEGEYEGHIALLTGLRYPDRFAAVATNSTILDINAQMAFYRNSDYQDDIDFWSITRDLAVAPDLFWRKLSYKKFYQDMQIPVFILHHEKSEIVSVKQAQKLKKRILSANKNNEFKIHQRFSREMDDIVEFFKKNPKKSMVEKKG